MKFTQIQIRLVQRSFGKATTKRRLIADLFYDRLFELDPTLRPLFQTGNREEQGRRFMQMLALTVASLGDEKAITNQMQAFGRRYLQAGLKQAHYDAVGTALLWALEKGLDKDFTPAIREAWRAVYHTLADTAKSTYATTR